MDRITVELAERSYPIMIGNQLLTAGGIDLSPYIKGRRVMLVTNETVAPLYLAAAQSFLADYQVDSVVLPDGEQYKTLAQLDHIFTALLDKQHGRDTTVVALGGGVIGDMAGFAAACYQRGVHFVQLPTTLLAQVDSSVGGKTAVNHLLGKNMIGAFYQPQAVFIDTQVLRSLPARELSAGLAEVIKYGIIYDLPFFEWLEQNISELLTLNDNALVYAIGRCCQIKAEIVAADETEQGQRALLNLGHTFGHAIETAQGYGNWLHGEAVAAGTVLAAKTALAQGLLNEQDLQRIVALLKACQLPTEKPADMSFDTFINLMMRDKKVLNGQLRLILPKRIGSALIVDNVPTSLLQSVIGD